MFSKIIVGPTETLDQSSFTDAVLLDADRSTALSVLRMNCKYFGNNACLHIKFGPVAVKVQASLGFQQPAAEMNWDFQA